MTGSFQVTHTNREWAAGGRCLHRSLHQGAAIAVDASPCINACPWSPRASSLQTQPMPICVCFVCVCACARACAHVRACVHVRVRMPVCVCVCACVLAPHHVNCIRMGAAGPVPRQNSRSSAYTCCHPAPGESIPQQDQQQQQQQRRRRQGAYREGRPQHVHYRELFPVQSVVWNELAGGASTAHDLCIAAPTGSGKTLAYALPIINSLARWAHACARAHA